MGWVIYKFTSVCFCASVWALWQYEIQRTVWFSFLHCREVHPLCFLLPFLSQERVKTCILALRFPLMFPWSLLTSLFREEMCYNTTSPRAINTCHTLRCTKRFRKTWISRGWRWSPGSYLEEGLFICIIGLKHRVLKNIWGSWGKDHLWVPLLDFLLNFSVEKGLEEAFKNRKCQQKAYFLLKLFKKYIFMCLCF